MNGATTAHNGTVLNYSTTGSARLTLNAVWLYNFFMTLKAQAEYPAFATLDIRVGRIVDVQDADTKKPTYRLTVDFGPEVGIKRSCGAYRNYSKEFLLGKQVIGIVNFAVKKMGPERSEALILGVPTPQGETIFLMPQADVDLGVEVF